MYARSSKAKWVLALAAGLLCFGQAFAVPPIPQKAGGEEPSLGLLLAQRMISLQDSRPTPSLGYQLSSRMVRKNRQEAAEKPSAVKASAQPKLKRAKNSKSNASPDI